MQQKTDRIQAFYRTVEQIQIRNADTDPDKLLMIIDAAVRDVRKQSCAKTREALSFD